MLGRRAVKKELCTSVFKANICFFKGRAAISEAAALVGARRAGLVFYGRQTDFMLFNNVTMLPWPRSLAPSPVGIKKEK